MKSITFIEPVWQGGAHLVANAGLIRIVHAALPNADKTYIGDEQQFQLIKQLDPVNSEKEIKHVPWQAAPDEDTLPTMAWRVRKSLIKKSSDTLKNSELIVLTSCSASSLTAITWLGLAHKCIAVLHGNANELSGWRSRNPVRKLFDLTSSLKRFCLHGGTVVVLEERIKQGLSEQFPWISKSIQCLPHALAPEEAPGDKEEKSYAFPIRIGFAGLATDAKGFPEFLKLAQEVSKRKPGAFEFYAYGKIHAECEKLDQSMLMTRAGSQHLSREDFVNGLNHMHYIFVWHKDFYYANAASGVLYDAVNLGIPVIARKGSQVSEWESSGKQIGSSHSSLEDAVEWICGINVETEAKNYLTQVSNLAIIRDSLGVPHLAQTFTKIAKTIAIA